MADRLSMRIITGPVRQEMRAIHKLVDDATVIALRETAKLVSREAKKAAPVYAGSDKRATPGEYRKSIRVSRRLRRPLPHVFALTIAPRGKHPRQYAYKLEDQYEPMKQGKDLAEPAVKPIHAKAWEKAIQRR